MSPSVPRSSAVITTTSRARKLNAVRLTPFSIGEPRDCDACAVAYVEYVQIQMQRARLLCQGVWWPHPVATAPGSAFGSRTATAFDSRAATAFGSRTATAFDSRAATAFGSRTANAEPRAVATGY